MHSTNGADKRTWLNKDDVDLFFEELITKIYPLALKGDEFCKRIVLAIGRECYRRFLRKGKPDCVNDSILSIDLNGNTYSCHHNNASKYITGNIFDKKIIPLISQRTDRWFSSEDCQSCEALPVCHGGCYLTNTHDVECHWYKIM